MPDHRREPLGPDLLAACLALGLRTPEAATTTTAADRGVPVGSVNWEQVSYPLDCGTNLQGPVGTQVYKLVYVLAGGRR